MLSTYYSPYPTMTNLKSGLGQPGEEKWGQYLRKLAGELGITLPPRPANLDETGAEAAMVLEAIDVIAAQLRVMFQRYSIMLHKGGAICADLLAYNRLAIRAYEIQMDIVKALERAKVPGVPPAPPWPPLFLGFGSNKAPAASSYWEIDCKQRIIGWSPSDQSHGVRVYLQNPACSPGGAQLGVAVITMAIGATLLGTIVGTALYFRKGAAVEIAAAKEASKKLVESLEFMRARQELIDLRTEKCAQGASGQKYEDCLEAAADSVEDLDTLLDLLDAVKQEGPREGRGLLWWIGLGAVVAGGVVAYKIVKKRRQGRPRTAELVTT
jgi:hypothetical protein